MIAGSGDAALLIVLRLEKEGRFATGGKLRQAGALDRPLWSAVARHSFCDCLSADSLFGCIDLERTD
jgi:hypothetical protein